MTICQQFSDGNFKLKWCICRQIGQMHCPLRYHMRFVYPDLSDLHLFLLLCKLSLFYLSSPFTQFPPMALMRLCGENKINQIKLLPQCVCDGRHPHRARAQFILKCQCGKYIVQYTSSANGRSKLPLGVALHACTYCTVHAHIRFHNRSPSAHRAFSASVAFNFYFFFWAESLIG